MAAERWSDPEAVRCAAEVLGEQAWVDAPLGALTTSRVGGPAAVGFEANGPADLRRVQQASAESGLEILTVGRGSNLLVSDRGLEGIALRLGSAYERIGLHRATATVSAGAAAALPVLARRCASVGIGGLEWAVGVPGSVGGGVRMNAGGHGSDMAESLIDADIVDLSASGADAAGARRVAADGLSLGYRTSGLGDRRLVVGARLRGCRADPAAAMQRIADIVRWRRQHQPGGQNAGSVFKNPPGASAGELIHGAGLRGLRIGTAAVSRLHANFIVSDPGGTAADVVALMEEIRIRVEASTGVVLQLEVRMVGFEKASAPA